MHEKAAAIYSTKIVAIIMAMESGIPDIACK